jgi:hypothetical protein
MGESSGGVFFHRWVHCVIGHAPEDPSVGGQPYKLQTTLYIVFGIAFAINDGALVEQEHVVLIQSHTDNSCIRLLAIKRGDRVKEPQMLNSPKFRSLSF